MKKIFLAVLTMAIIISLHAQDKWEFASQNYVGLLEGEDGGTLQVHTINGVQKKGWFTGAGIGLDYYYYRSIPLFISVSKFLPMPKPFFVNANGGINFPWPRKVDGSQDRNVIISKYPVTPFWEAAVGYKIRLSRSEDGILLSAGYSFKQVKERLQKVNPCLIPPCPFNYEEYDYRLRRVSLKLGYAF